MNKIIKTEFYKLRHNWGFILLMFIDVYKRQGLLLHDRYRRL